MAPVLGRYPGGTVLQVVDTIVQPGRTWEKVRDAADREGFLPGGTSMELGSGAAVAPAAIPSPGERLAAVARRNMLVGGLWCGGGIAVTAFTYAHASGGRTVGQEYVYTAGLRPYEAVSR